MEDTPLACIILAAGRGKRMKSSLPKVAHELAGRPLIGWVLNTVTGLKPEKIVTVLAPDMDDLASALKPHTEIAIQPEARGTGDAVRAALGSLKNFTGDVLILLGDMPLITAPTLEALIAARHRNANTKISVAAAHFNPPPAFGRLVLDTDGSLLRIVEDKDCTPDERSLTLCNLGAFCVDSTALNEAIPQLTTKNAQGEYYLTDIVSLIVKAGGKASAHTIHDIIEASGVNSRADLAALEQAVQVTLRRRAMDNGATLIAPDTVTFSLDTALGQDVIVEPYVFFGPGVTVADNAHIKAFSHIEGAIIGADATIGPHARLRPGSVIGAGARVGNFVEIKNATLGNGVKANHLAYIGDATLGAGTNFSCGAITANYDGVNKHKTVIGDNVMVGSNVTLVAPVSVGSNAYLAAGSTINEDVPAQSLAIARERQTVHQNWQAKKKTKN